MRRGRKTSAEQAVLTLRRIAVRNGTAPSPSRSFASAARPDRRQRRRQRRRPRPRRAGPVGLEYVTGPATFEAPRLRLVGGSRIRRRGRRRRVRRRRAGGRRRRRGGLGLLLVLAGREREQADERQQIANSHERSSCLGDVGHEERHPAAVRSSAPRARPLGRCRFIAGIGEAWPPARCRGPAGRNDAERTSREPASGREEARRQRPRPWNTARRRTVARPPACVTRAASGRSGIRRHAAFGYTAP